MTEKQESLKDALKSIKKQGLHIGALSESVPPIEALSTGNLGIDTITGIGGLPRGRIIELYGLPSSGKSTTAIQAAVQAQRQGLIVLYLDYENAFDPAYCQALGLDIDAETFLFSQPDTLEQGMNALRRVTRTGELGLAIVDSVAMMISERELEADVGGSKFSDKAKLMYQLMRQLAVETRKSKTTVVFLNHLLTKIDMSPMGARLSAQGIKQKTTPGGEAVKFYASVRLEFRQLKRGKSKEDNPLTGEREDASTSQEVGITCVKNKVGPPYRSAVCHIRYGAGFSQVWTALDILESHGAVKKSGATYKFPPELEADYPKGEANIVEFIEAQEGLAAKVVAMAAALVKPKEPVVEDEEIPEVPEEVPEPIIAPGSPVIEVN